MNRTQVQGALRSRGLSRRKKNQYTQGSSRTKVAWGWSDCSSFVRWCYLRVLGVDIGGYTGAQVSNGNLITVHSGGSKPDVSKLEIGDLIYFWSPSSSKPEKVCHVEMYIGDGKLLGHGSGTGPTQKVLTDYCKKMRYLKTRRAKVLETTWALGSRTIEKGCYGEDVQEMQRGLILLGFVLGGSGADWDCGDATDAAIRKFQKAYKLDVDGQFGPKSLAKFRALLGAYAPPEITDPLTEDDYPDVPELPSIADDSDPPVEDEDADDAGDEPEVDEDISPEADGYAGANAVNPYPVPTKTKKKGSKGATIKWIQWELIQSGGELGAYGTHKDGIDGEFGSATDKAVRAFQRAHKDASGKALEVDGEVGPKTRAALLAEGAPDADSGADDGIPPVSEVVDGEGCVYDVSSYDGDIDFAKLAALTGPQRCLLLIIRAQASESGTKVDPKLARNIKNCKKHSIPYAVYAYTYAGTEAAGKADADRFFANVTAAGGDPLFWAIDAEEGKNTQASTEAMRKRLEDWIGADGAVWFYSFDSRCRSWASIMKNYDGVWSARWNTPDIAPDYKGYALWQHGYTNVPGIRKTTDTSRLHPKKTLAQVLVHRAAS